MEKILLHERENSKSFFTAWVYFLSWISGISPVIRENTCEMLKRSGCYIQQSTIWRIIMYIRISKLTSFDFIYRMRFDRITFWNVLYCLDVVLKGTCGEWRSVFYRTVKHFYSDHKLQFMALLQQFLSLTQCLLWGC